MALIRQIVIIQTQNFNTLEVIIEELLQKPNSTELLMEKLEQVERVIACVPDEELAIQWREKCANWWVECSLLTEEK